MAEYTSKLNLAKPAYEEFADVGALNDNMDKIDAAFAGLGTNEVLEKRVTALESDKAPIMHSSATTEYGAASTTQYGHTKLYSGIDSESETLAATPKAVRAVKTVALSKVDKVAGGKVGNVAVLTPDGGVADGGLKFSIYNGGLRITYNDGE